MREFAILDYKGFPTMIKIRCSVTAQRYLPSQPSALAVWRRSQTRGGNRREKRAFTPGHPDLKSRSGPSLLQPHATFVGPQALSSRAATSQYLPNSQRRPYHTHLGSCFRRFLALPQQLCDHFQRLAISTGMRPPNNSSQLLPPSGEMGTPDHPRALPPRAHPAPAPPWIAMATVPLPA